MRDRKPMFLSESEVYLDKLDFAGAYLARLLLEEGELLYGPMQVAVLLRIRPVSLLLDRSKRT